MLYTGSHGRLAGNRKKQRRLTVIKTKQAGEAHGILLEDYLKAHLEKKKSTEKMRQDGRTMPPEDKETVEQTSKLQN